MGHLFYVCGKSSTGKDTIYRKLMEDASLNLKAVVPYTTRPIRAGEEEGREYHFTDIEELERLTKAGLVIERRCYHTMHGDWHYYTVDDGNINLAENNYLIIGTLESYIKTRDYFGEDRVLPIYIELDDGERLQRALTRERLEVNPKYAEMCRRFLADMEDFAAERIEEAGIVKRFVNNDLNVCYNEVCDYICSVNADVT